MTHPGLRVGVWLEWPAGTRLRGEGIWVLLQTLITHMAGGRAGFVIMAPPWMIEEISQLRDQIAPEHRDAVRVVTTTASQARLRRRAARSWAKQKGGGIMHRAPLRWLRALYEGGVAALRRTEIEWRAAIDALIPGQTYALMAREATAMADIDVWFLPFAGFTHATAITRPKVCVFHDFLFDEFPGLYDPTRVRQTRERFGRVLANVDACITLSDHVRERHVIAGFAVPAKRVFVVPPAPMDRRGVLDFTPADFTRTPTSRARAAALLRGHCAKPVAGRWPPGPDMSAFLGAFPFEHVDYIVVSTQTRPHKKVRMVVEAVEHLIRREGRAIKLILTGKYYLDNPADEIGAFVAARDLRHDVLTLWRLPIDVHTALYHAGALTVHPSPFEASFPFPFGESVSVGTPVILARSAVVAAALDGTPYARLAYDHESPAALRAAITWALDHRDEALALGVALFRERTRRSWSDVADEHAAIFAAAGKRPVEVSATAV